MRSGPTPNSTSPSDMPTRAAPPRLLPRRRPHAGPAPLRAVRALRACAGAVRPAGSRKRPAAAPRGRRAEAAAAAAMAEAAPRPGRYFCHCCSVEIVPRLPVRPGRGGAGRARRSGVRGDAGGGAAPRPWGRPQDRRLRGAGSPRGPRGRPRGRRGSRAASGRRAPRSGPRPVLLGARVFRDGRGAHGGGTRGARGRTPGPG